MLDEGIDVPDANLGIVMSGSRTRRQMIQRMGRILRRKEPGVGARFVIMFAKDTIEDPGARAERDGFIEELERISEASAVFDADRFRGLEVPTLLLGGGDSPSAFKAANEALRAALPDARIAVMPGQRHAAMDTGPDLFLAAVLPFLQTSPPTETPRRGTRP